ncbi:MAG TPA: hypothetical protein VK131_11925, partial [Candidatus Acidoferrales bacterium]|nr:hypothetical protein [Candidatus Acidoferrales bacterium]
MRALISLVLALVIAGCAGGPAHYQPNEPRYTVITDLDAKDGVVHACHGHLLSLPSPFCEGIEVR